MQLCEIDDGGYQVKGVYQLDAKYKDVHLTDNYELKIIIPPDYPDNLPTVFELSDKIPKEFDHVFTDGSLCLGVRTELMRDSKRGMDIKGFLGKYINSYLFSVTFFVKYNGAYPFGERSHGATGILEFYMEIFNVITTEQTLELMVYICRDNYRGHALCPCKSGERIRKCHGEILLLLIKERIVDNVLQDIYLITRELEEWKKAVPKSR